MRFLILALFLSAPGLLFAIEHSGTVRAADQFIPGATVTAVQGGAKLVTYTDQNGRYYLDLTPGVWEIEISMFGFKTLTSSITVKDQFTSRDWTLEMPRLGEPAEPAKPAAAETKKPDAAPAATPATLRQRLPLRQRRPLPDSAQRPGRRPVRSGTIRARRWWWPRQSAANRTAGISKRERDRYRRRRPGARCGRQ